MYYRTGTYLAIILATVLTVLPAGCTKEEPPAVENAPSPIVLDGFVGANRTESGTKTITDGNTLPHGYSIFTSAYYTDPEFPATSGDYFTGVKFSWDGAADGWLPASGIFWPLTGNGNVLDFLAVATELELGSSMVWAGQDDNFLLGERNVHGVKMRVPVSNNDTEVLYATASKQCSDKRPVEMNFKHTQCCLEFRISLQTNLNDLLRLSSIVVEDACTSGECCIETHPFVSVKWNFDNAEPHATEVPGIDDVPVTMPVTPDQAPLVYDMVLPPQPRRNIVLNFRQLSSSSGSEDDWKTLSICPAYTVSTDAAKWEADKKYIFEIIIKFGEIIIVPSVAEWKEGEDIVIPVNPAMDGGSY